MSQGAASLKLEKLAFINNTLVDKRSVININGAFELTRDQEKDAMSYITDLFAKAIDKSEIVGNNSIILFVYLKHYSSSKIRKSFILSLVGLLIRLYPDTLYKCYLIDTGQTFKTILTALTALIPSMKDGKIIFCKSE